MKRLAAVVLLAAMTAPAPAGAGTIARSLEELGRRVKPGQKVQVLERSGRLTEGVITEVSESSLTVFAGETRTVPAEEVLRVDREGDSVQDGIVKGAIVGAAAGAVVWLDSRGKSEEQLAAESCDGCGSPKFVAIGAAEGVLVGWLIDHFHKGRTLMYEGPLSRPRASIGVAPVVGDGRRGLSVAVAF
jgi:hypothetical protein